MTGRRHRDTLASVADFLFWEPLLADEQRAQLLAVECPRCVLGVEMPVDLNSLTFEQLIRLWSVKTSRDLFTAVANEILHKSERDILRADLLPVLGACNFVARELARISELWQSIPSTHTPEELQAGCQRLQFGVFGIADWYARRMGMHNHDEAFATPWVRIYQCMRNDAEEAQYRKRLNEIINQKHKIK